MSLRNIFKEYKKSKNKYEFCKENFLNDKALMKSVEIYEQLISYLKKIKYDEFNSKNKNEQIEDKIEQIDLYLNSLKNQNNFNNINNNENKNDNTNDKEGLSKITQRLVKQKTSDGKNFVSKRRSVYLHYRELRLQNGDKFKNNNKANEEEKKKK